jgi:LDH2 family malate/lactate/ureidoglycolate dehydrogenase
VNKSLEVDRKMACVKSHELERFVAAVLRAAGASDEDATAVAAALVWADLRARYTQGVQRLPMFVRRLQRGLIVSPARMQWTPVGSAAAQLDAGNGFGHVAGRQAMYKAIELARAHGVGAVTVRRSNLYGAAGYYCWLAAEAQCLGMTCTNAVSKVAPYGGVQPVFGTNPIAFACPTGEGIPILIDLATSAIAGSSVRSLEETGERLPEGVALDRMGQPTTDPHEIVEGALLPAAGAKGYALAMMVEILAGVLSGAAVGKEVGSMYTTWDRPVNTGHFFLAIDIGKFVPLARFVARVDTMLAAVRAAAPEGGRLYFPGERRGRWATQYENEGIPLPAESVNALKAVAEQFKLEPPPDLR